MIEFLKKDRPHFDEWDSIGSLQLDVMVAEGLAPESRLLDIGCGFLRGGKNFMEYLAPGGYYGVEKDPVVLHQGKVWLEELGFNLDAGEPTFKVNEDFDFDFGVKFDFAIAQSVFTHLMPAKITACLNAVSKVLKLDGTFVATFFVGEGKVKTWAGKRSLTTYDGEDPFHYSYGFIKNLLAEAGFTCEVLAWDHPRHQTFVKLKRRMT